MTPDTSSYDRFKTSLGVVLVIASISLTYAFFSNIDVFLVGESELNSLTPTGKAVVEQRQAWARGLEVPILGLAVLLLVMGLALLVQGAGSLKTRQSYEDREIQRRLGEAGLVFSETGTTFQTLVSRVWRFFTTRSADDPLDARGGEVTKEPPRVDTPTLPDAKSSLSQQVRERKRVADEVAAVFQSSEFPAHIFRSDGRIIDKMSQSSIRVDGLLTSTVDQYPNVAVELKVAWNLRSAYQVSANFYRAFQRVDEGTGLRIWLIVIVARTQDPAPRSQLRQTEKKLDDMLDDAGRATVIYEDEIQYLPQIFGFRFLGFDHQLPPDLHST